MVAASALLWSFGGTINRFITVTDPWTVVFWRSYLATVFLLLFMVLRDGPDGTHRLFRNMGWAGVAVGMCFAIASMSFVVALGYTSVANILLMQAGVPLLAALLAWALFREKPSLSTWLAIAAVIIGVFIMVSDARSDNASLIGNGLAILIAVMFSIATVITRRKSDVHMTPAVTLGTAVATVVSAGITASSAANLSVSLADFAWLVAFGAINLGLGLAMFAMGARLIPAALAALIGTLEPVLGPVWVWLVHGEVPSDRTVIGGSVVFVALFVHLLLDFLRARRSSPRAVPLTQ